MVLRIRASEAVTPSVETKHKQWAHSLPLGSPHIQLGVLLAGYVRVNLVGKYVRANGAELYPESSREQGQCEIEAETRTEERR